MTGFVRIIGGQHRGRKLKVPDAAGVRPTPDRVRETLFNWLSPVIAGAHCLDVFAGSGVLGFEALSRGATHVVMVDNDSRIVELLQQESKIFNITQAEIYTAQAPAALRRPNRPFDIVFLDPPYNTSLLLSTCAYLAAQAFLAEQAYIYLEAERPIEDNELPLGWRLLKSQHAGQVYYHLVLAEKSYEHNKT